MGNVSTHITAALAALFIATASIGAIVHVPQDNAMIAAAALGTVLA